jgi:hypothetical protein
VALTERAAENGTKRACAFMLLQQAQHPAPVATLRAPESLQLLSMHSQLTRRTKVRKGKEKKHSCIERLDQGHIYPLGEHRDKHVTVGARTYDPLHRRRPLKELSRQLIHWLFGTSTWPESGSTARPLQLEQK